MAKVHKPSDSNVILYTVIKLCEFRQKKSKRSQIFAHKREYFVDFFLFRIWDQYALTKLSTGSDSQAKSERRS
jgi:hypothetical protein